MAKRKSSSGKRNAVADKTAVNVEAWPLEQKEKSWLSFMPQGAKLALLILLGLALYINSVNNESALDDGMVIENNPYVMRGFKGIKDIFTHDAFHGYFDKMKSKDPLAGGRYRPLSIATFAVEQELFGTYPSGAPGPTDWDSNRNGRADPEEDVNRDGLFNEKDSYARGAHVRHAVNILLYVLSVMLLFLLLNNHLFKNFPDVSFLTSWLFLIHPLHAEVVVNIKSRDEILSFLFIVLTLLFFAQFVETRKSGKLAVSLAMFFLALLSKEYAITLLVLLPVLVFIFYGGKKSLKKLSFAFIPFVIAALVYLAMRIKFAGMGWGQPITEVLINPYLFATAAQKKATIVYVLAIYMKLLIFPHPLSSDYSYAQISYRDFGDMEVWFSLLLHLAIAYYAVRLVLKRHPLGFALLIYLGNLALVGNVFFDVGATMGERLIYHSSLGFAMAAAWGLMKLLNKWRAADRLKRASLLAAAAVITVLCGVKTVGRNAEWKNDDTLFFKDVQTVPNSVRANGNAGARYVDIADRPANREKRKELLVKAVYHLTKAVDLYPQYMNGHINLGLAQYKLGDVDQAKSHWDKAREMSPRNPYLAACYSLLTTPYVSEGFKYGQEGKIDLAIESFKKAAEINPADAELWYNLGSAFYYNKQYDQAYECWVKTMQLNPDHEKAKKGLSALRPVKKSSVS